MPTLPKWNALRREDIELNIGNAAVWRRVYDELLPALQFVESLLTCELAAFEEQSGLDRLALWTVRIKSFDSFLDKLRALGLDRTRLDRHFGAHGAVSVFDLVQDLVAGRQVFYFERDIQDAVLFWMSFPVYMPIDVTLWAQDMSGHDSAITSAARWIGQLAGNKGRAAAAPKRSGYESLHFVLSLDTKLLAARFPRTSGSRGAHSWKQRIATAWATLAPATRLLIAEVTFEIQCRTVLEHTWAEVEHRARYSAAKTRHHHVNAIDGQVRTFRNYKAILRAAQIFQNSIKSGFSLWDSSDNALRGRSTRLELGSRARDFDRRQQRSIKAFASSITKAMEVRGSSPAAEVSWQKLLTDYEHLLRAIGYHDKLELSTDLTFKEYRQRRILVMLLGFIMAYAVDENRESEGLSKVRLEAANLYFEHNLSNRVRPWVSPSVAAVRLYEHLRLLDSHYAQNRPENFCFDPLVDARAASVYFRHHGSIRRSSALLEEAIRRSKKWKNPHRHDALILSEKYLRHRLAENYWAAYNLDGQASADLKAGLAQAQQALEASGSNLKPPQLVREINERAAAHVATMLLYERLERLRSPDSQESELRWSALSATAERLQEISPALSLIKWHAGLAKSSLRLQGHGVMLACKAANAKKQKDCEALLQRARRAVRDARRNAVDKLATNTGGVLPFHVDVGREVEALVFSLSAADRPNSLRGDR